MSMDLRLTVMLLMYLLSAIFIVTMYVWDQL